MAGHLPAGAVVHGVDERRDLVPIQSSCFEKRERVWLGGHAAHAGDRLEGRQSRVHNGPNPAGANAVLRLLSVSSRQPQALLVFAPPEPETGAAVISSIL